MKNGEGASCLNSDNFISSDKKLENSAPVRRNIAGRARFIAGDLKIKTANALVSLQDATFFINEQTIISEISL